MTAPANELRAKHRDVIRGNSDRSRLTAGGSDNGRLMTCTRCGLLNRVYEASTGARTDDEHKWSDPADFVCCPPLKPNQEQEATP